jgi:hypothetical protein
VPSVVTKKAKKHWKRNPDKEESLKSCGWVDIHLNGLVTSMNIEFMTFIELLKLKFILSETLLTTFTIHLYQYAIYCSR